MQKATRLANRLSAKVPNLQRFDVLGLEALWPLNYVELHLLAFLQAPEATRLNS